MTAVHSPAPSSSSTAARLPPFPRISRNVAIAGGVIVFHAAALWAVQSGLARKVAEVVVPVEILAQIIAPPKPAPPPPPPPQPRKEVVTKKPVTPKPIAIRDPAPTPNAPVGAIEPPPPAPAPPAPPAPAPPAPVAPPVPPAPPAPPAPKLIEVTEGQVQYIREPAVSYPSVSRRLGETGKVIVGIYFSADGYAKRVTLEQGSGYERLDKAAMDAAAKAQVTPIRRAGANAETVFLLRAPFNFVLN
ncbi:TonB family protein [Xylophilus sp. Kf1]|nr:TonB family protein [Xylophilus sp. Kf1]